MKKQFLTVTVITTLVCMSFQSCKKKEETPSAKKDVIITWANPANIVSGTALSATQLNAIADAPGTLVYTPVIGTVLSAGAAQNLKVDFTPTDAVNYNTATKTVSINVTQLVAAAFTWKEDAGALITADSAYWTTWSSGTGIRAYKGGMQNFFEINWATQNNTAVGAKALIAGNLDFTFLKGTTSYDISSNQNLNITGFTSGKLSGNFTFSVSGGTITSIAATFTDLPQK